jgi:hypothetical protein
MRTVITVSKLATLGLVVLFGMAFSLPTYAGTQLWDFEKKTDDWKVANGKWEIKGGVYHVERGGRAEHSLVGEEDWDDYTIEAKVRLDEHNDSYHGAEISGIKSRCAFWYRTFAADVRRYPIVGL